MNRGPEISRIERSFQRQKERFQSSQGFSLTVLFLPFLGALVLSLFVGLETSMRLQGGSEPFEYASEPVNDHELWLSIGLVDESVVVRTADNGFFVWPTKGPSQGDYAKLENHLQQWTKKHLTNVVRSGQIDSYTNTAALAIDQRLNYHHVRPVIYALASAGISRYGFETRIPTQ